MNTELLQKLVTESGMQTFEKALSHEYEEKEQQLRLQLAKKMTTGLMSQIENGFVQKKKREAKIRHCDDPRYDYNHDSERIEILEKISAVLMRIDVEKLYSMPLKQVYSSDELLKKEI